jgi:hypothetical protein
MERITTINARQLFLLCALRNTSVEAKNLSEHLWTFRHDNFVIKGLDPDNEEIDPEVLKLRLKEEAKEKFPTFDCRYRNFYVYEGQMTFDLTEAEEDMSWYIPLFPNDESNYQGMFELKTPLDQKEKFLLFDFLKIPIPRNKMSV